MAQNNLLWSLAKICSMAKAIQGQLYRPDLFQQQVIPGRIANADLDW